MSSGYEIGYGRSRIAHSVVHMRPTTPPRYVSVVDSGIATFQGNTKASALRSVHEMSESAYQTLEMSADGWLTSLGITEITLDMANLGRQSFSVT